MSGQDETSDMYDRWSAKPWWVGKMYRPELTPLCITSRWLQATGGGGAGDLQWGEGFEVATWADSWRDRMRAKVVIGPTGCEKNAWGTVTPFNSDHGEAALDKFRRRVNDWACYNDD